MSISQFKLVINHRSLSSLARMRDSLSYLPLSIIQGYAITTLIYMLARQSWSTGEDQPSPDKDKKGGQPQGHSPGNNIINELANIKYYILVKLLLVHDVYV